MRRAPAAGRGRDGRRAVLPEAAAGRARRAQCARAAAGRHQPRARLHAARAGHALPAASRSWHSRCSGSRGCASTRTPRGRHRAPYFVSMSRQEDCRRLGAEAGAAAGRAHRGCPRGAPTASASPSPTRPTRASSCGSARPRRARAWKLKGVAVNAVYGEPVQWMPDNRTLLVQTVPAKRGTPPAEASVPKAPNIQESSGKPRPRAHLSRPSEERARRGALRLLRHLAARLRRRGVGEGDDARSPRHLRRGRALARRQAPPRRAPAPSVLVPPPGRRLPQGGRGLGQERKGRPQDREPAARGRGADRGRADGAALVPVAADRAGDARLGRGARRRRPARRRFRTATAS